MMPIYDSIGQSYSKFRLPDPRIVDSLVNLLQADASIVETGVNLLKEDLDSGQWDTKYGEIRKLEAFDAGYRFLCARLV